MKNNRMIVTVVALLAISAFCAVMVAAGQPVAAVAALIPSIALGVQQIVQAGSGPVDRGPVDRGPADRRFADRRGPDPDGPDPDGPDRGAEPPADRPADRGPQGEVRA
ncbi:hypothetical protein SUDANB120_00666 [Streptomyces sp. enrichment culture]|uniref:hypothetical protein n=1 Tax=Streptomyces TaxID=1883 RepID=UPI00167644F4|nr:MULTISPECIES: hypothetical protein [Streptomyces]MBD3576975.1 hypothetical protein [Streptomyces sp. KD18]GGT04764.1 hypothetical protein GCM10010286_32410 [Streptomyces toxytricini]